MTKFAQEHETRLNTLDEILDVARRNIFMGLDPLRRVKRTREADGKRVPRWLTKAIDYLEACQSDIRMLSDRMVAIRQDYELLYGMLASSSTTSTNRRQRIAE